MPDASSSPLLDALDRQILARLQADCQCKAEALGADIGLSASAVQRRIKRLRAQGVIQAEVAVLDPQRVSAGLTLITGIEFGQDNYAALAQARVWAAREPAIQQLYYVTGASDLVAIVVAHDMKDYDTLCERLMREHPEIRRMTTQVVIEPLKRGLAVPVDRG